MYFNIRLYFNIYIILLYIFILYFFYVFVSLYYAAYKSVSKILFWILIQIIDRLQWT